MSEHPCRAHQRVPQGLGRRGVQLPCLPLAGQQSPVCPKVSSGTTQTILGEERLPREDIQHHHMGVPALKAMRGNSCNQ